MDCCEMEKIKTPDGKEHIVALNYNKNGRKFVITIEKKIFEEKDDETYVECLEPDEDNNILFECLKTPKTDAIDIDLKDSENKYIDYEER